MQAPDQQVIAEGRADADSAPTEKHDPVISVGISVGLKPTISGYELIKQLGSGAYGDVWLAERNQDGIPVKYAIKIFKASRRVGARWLELQQEIKTLADLREDPGIVRIEKADLLADPPYLVMRFAEGGTLGERLKAGALPVAEALAVFRKVSAALAYVHAKGICHCDIKPGNVLLDAVGQPLVADFGQAQLTSDGGLALGTYFYMSPQQANEESVLPDPSWDVYALGALFYAMVTRRPPREDPTLRNRIEQTTELSNRLRSYRDTLEQAPKPDRHRKLPGMDATLAAIIDRCLSLQGEERYRDAGRLQRALAERDQWLRRKPLLYIGMAASVLVILGGLIISLMTNHQSMKQAEGAIGKQLRDEDQDTAELAATVISEKLGLRIKALRRLAAQPELVQGAIRGDGQFLKERLSHFLGECQQIFGEDDFFQFAWLANPQGEMQALLSMSDGKPVDKLPENNEPHWRWRGWFNGIQDFHDGESHNQFHEPLNGQDLFVAEPNFPKTNNSEKMGAQVAISTLLRDSEGKVIGVLGAAVAVKKFHDWLRSKTGGDSKIDESSKTDDQEKTCFVVLFNDVGHCLVHRQDVNDLIKANSNENPKKWQAYQQLREVKWGLTNFTDPVLRAHQLDSGQEFVLGGFARIIPDPRRYPDINWGVLILHENEAVRKPMKAMRAGLGLTMLMNLGLMSAIVLAAWVGLYRLLRHKELAHA